MSEKVLVGLSGGVDSAVAAYLLKEQGYDVTCAFMRNWDALANQDIKGNPTILDDICPQEQDYLDAKCVADKLGLELLRVDFVKEYWDRVFSSFLSEYKQGRTPNPDILCNKYIKFDSFLNYALSLGFTKIATGHYAQITVADDEFTMLRGIDDNKDQTYFLCQLSQKALSHTYFPIGNLQKSEVREIAKKLDLNSVSSKKDSTGVCFIGERNFKEFLQNYLPSKEGEIIDVDSKKVVGKHIGVLYYTIGQRKGFGVGGNQGPWFVVGKDIEKNHLFISSGHENRWLYSNSCIVTNVNWISKKEREKTMHCTAKFRYRQKDNPIMITWLNNDTVRVDYPSKIEAVTEGQEAVFYDNEVCLGGGVIDRVLLDGQLLQEKIKEEVYGNKK